MVCKHNSCKDKTQTPYTLASEAQNIYLTVLNIKALKLAPILAQFLYTHKRLDLPGLGSFLLDPSVITEPENSKQGKHSNLEGVSFETNTSIKEAPELIQFISAQTGKIKALAAADLDSHLSLAQQFLNIGKPFMLEGIGSLEKNSRGEFSFRSGQMLSVPMKDNSVKEKSSAQPTEESAGDYKSVFYLPKTKTTWRKPIAVLLLGAGLAFAIWGGYTVYKRTTAKNNKAPVEKKNDENVLVQDTSTSLQQKDSTINLAPIAVTPAGNYKFIIETAVKERALSRFGKLKSFGLNVQMETKDSASFKLFFILPAAIADTARMIDSLRGIYTPAGSRAHIEN